MVVLKTYAPVSHIATAQNVLYRFLVPAAAAKPAVRETKTLEIRCHVAMTSRQLYTLK